MRRELRLITLARKVEHRRSAADSLNVDVEPFIPIKSQRNLAMRDRWREIAFA